MFGFLNLNKPLGLTSHDCVAKVRRLLQIKRVGHAGTLDPLASGVLPIAVGSATRLLQFLPTGKAYRAKIRLGQVTTTDDLEGEILASTPAPDLSLEQVQAHLGQFIGQIQQVPPLFSAIQVEGKRLYKRAIAGESPQIPPRTVEISAIEVLGWQSGEFPELDVAITCGGGTYIRAIARDLGQVLGCGGTLAGLIRTASSGFDLATSITFDQLETSVQEDTLHLCTVDQSLTHIAALELSPEAAYRWCLGQSLPWPHTADSADSATTPPRPLVASATPVELNSWIRLYNPQHIFLGMAQVVNGIETGRSLRPKVVLAPPIKMLAETT